MLLRCRAQAETLEDLRINLSTAEFDYGPYIEDLQVSVLRLAGS